MIRLKKKVVKEERDMIFTVIIVAEMDMTQRHVITLGRRSKTSKVKKKTETKHQTGQKTLNLLIKLFPIAILECQTHICS